MGMVQTGKNAGFCQKSLDGLGSGHSPRTGNFDRNRAVEIIIKSQENLTKTPFPNLPKKGDPMYGTRLHQETSVEEIDRLLDGGWNVEVPGWMGETPLHSAARRGLPKIAEALIRRGAKVNACRPDRLDTPLHFASNADVAGVLIEHGAEIEALDWSDRTPLHWAAQFGRVDVAELLIQEGAGVDRHETNGATPLHWAAREGHHEIVRLLLGRGAKPDVKDQEGSTPLHLSAWRGKLEAVEELLRAGANPAVRDRSGKTPLHEARETGRQAIMERLRDAQNRTARTETPDRGTNAPIALTRVRLHPRRTEAVTVGEGAVLTRWFLDEPPRRLTSIQIHHAWFSDLAVAHDGDVFAVTTPENVIELRRWDDLELVAEVVCPTDGEGGLVAIDLSPDGCWIAVADSCEKVHLIDRPSGKLIATTDAGERTYSVRFDPSSGLLGTACSFQGGGMVRIARIGDGKLIPVIELNRSGNATSAERFVDTLVHLDFSPDGGSLALFETSAIYHDARPKGWRGDVVLYDVGTWKQRWKASVDAKATGDKRSLANAGHEMGFLTEVRFLNFETLACGATHGNVLFFRASNGKLMRRVQAHPEGPVVSLALDARGPSVWAAIGTGSGELRRVAL
jgi:ankyrin repeat protein